MRAEQIDWKPWWPRWISIDWGFEHPSAVYWHTSLPAGAAAPVTPLQDALGLAPGRQEVPLAAGGENHGRVVTYREYVTHRTPPRELAREIIDSSIARDGKLEKIDAIYLSPDAFARRTDEASIAEQMGDVFVAAGLPRPVPADDDRVGGWMLMYQMLEAGEWILTDNCIELIRTLPNLVRDPARIEDVRENGRRRSRRRRALRIEDSLRLALRPPADGAARAANCGARDVG